MKDTKSGKPQTTRMARMKYKKTLDGARGQGDGVLQLGADAVGGKPIEGDWIV